VPFACETPKQSLSHHRAALIPHADEQHPAHADSLSNATVCPTSTSARRLSYSSRQAEHRASGRLGPVTPRRRQLGRVPARRSGRAARSTPRSRAQPGAGRAAAPVPASVPVAPSACLVRAAPQAALTWVVARRTRRPGAETPRDARVGGGLSR
jgi:hypothetical protein